MEAPLAISLAALMAFVGGVALWSEPNGAAASTPTTAESAQTTFCFAAEGRRAEVALANERTLARAVIVLLDDERRELARVLREVPSEVALAADHPVSALGAMRGLPWRELGASERDLLERVLAGIANFGDAHGNQRELRELLSGSLEGATIGWAGNPAGDADFYLRIHAATYACELLRSTAGEGKVQTAARRLAR